MKRFLAAVLLTIGLASLGFGIGGGVSAEFMVGARNGGLEDASMVAICALSGAVLGIVLAVVLAFRLALPTLLGSAIMALLLGTASLGFFIWRGTHRKAGRGCVILENSTYSTKGVFR